MGDVERKILQVHDSFNKREPLWHEVLAVVHDENTAHVQLDVVVLLALALEHVERSAFRHEEHCAELEATLDREMLDLKVLLPVVGHGLVKCGVLSMLNLRWVAHPERLLRVELLPLGLDILDLLGLLWLVLLALVDFLNFGLVVTLLIVIIVRLIICDLLLLGLFSPKVDGVVDELGVLFNKVLETALLKVLHLILLHLENDARAAAKGLGLIWDNGEGPTSARLPAKLLILVVFRDDSHLLCHEVRGVETDSELPDHTNVTDACVEGLHESLGAGLGDSAEVVDEVCLGHANPSVLNGERVVGLVWDKTNAQLRGCLELRRVLDRLEPDFVQRIGCV